MKKYWLVSLLILSGFGCAREQVVPTTAASTTIQQSEVKTDFVVYVNDTRNWVTQSRGGKPCALYYGHESISYADTPATEAAPVLHFAPAATEDVFVRLTDEKGQTVLEEPVA